MSYDRYDDRRPPRRKSNTLMVVLLVLGGVLLVCGGTCAVGGYFYVRAVMALVNAPEEFLGKARSGDYAGAYNATSSGYKSRYTQQQFTDAMKKAGLDRNTGLVGQPTSTNGRGVILLNATVGVPGGTTTMTFTMAQEGGPLTFVLDDLTGPAIVYPGQAPPARPITRD